MVQQTAVRPQRGSQHREVLVDALTAHVLGHADRGDGIEGLSPKVPIVLEADLDTIGESGVDHAPTGQFGLRRADRDADDSRTVVLGGVHRHRSPTATDVEQALARSFMESELPTDQFVLRCLRGGEVHPRFREAGARVRHARSEDQAVEVVADVVVVTDRLRVAVLRVPSPARWTRLFRRRRQWAPNGADPAGGSDGRQLVRRTHLHVRLRDVPHRREDRVDVALDLEVAGDVGAADAELVRGPDQSAQRVRRPHVDHADRLGGPERSCRPRSRSGSSACRRASP